MTLRSLIHDIVLGADDPQTPAPPADGMARLYVFHGTFETEDDALAYCYDAPDANHPEPLTRDLPDAFINTVYVEVLWGETNDPALHFYFPQDTADQIAGATAASNTIVLIAEEAFGGYDFALNDTERLTYLGHWDVARK
jgi:hypothetical protein